MVKMNTCLQIIISSRFLMLAEKQSWRKNSTLVSAMLLMFTGSPGGISKLEYVLKMRTKFT